MLFTILQNKDQILLRLIPPLLFIGPKPVLPWPTPRNMAPSHLLAIPQLKAFEMSYFTRILFQIAPMRLNLLVGKEEIFLLRVVATGVVKIFFVIHGPNVLVVQLTNQETHPKWGMLHRCFPFNLQILLFLEEFLVLFEPAQSQHGLTCIPD